MSKRGAKTGVRVVVLTGAGISADSGVATFRGGDGLWEGHRVEDVATPEGWYRDPELVWRFYQMRRQQVAGVHPNAAHHALRTMETKLTAHGGSLVLVTQNVDDLHQRVGSSALAMHGQLYTLRCETCGVTVENRTDLDPDVFVPCAACGNERLRPDIVWFGEVPRFLPQIEDALNHCTHFLAIGTSGVVYPAAGFLSHARAIGAETWVVGLDEPDNLHGRDRFVRGRAAEVLPGQIDVWLADWLT